MRKAGNRPTIMLPEPIAKDVELSKSIAGDEEYWIQNLSGIQDGVSDINAPGGVRERDASLIEYMEPVSARKSNIGSVRQMEEDIEQRAGQSQGPVFGKQTTGGYVRERDGTQEDYYDGASAVFSNPSHITGGPGTKHATEQVYVNKSEADFDKTSALVQNKELVNPERR